MVHAPDDVPKNSEDLTTPRASVRSKGDAGFIFMNNYVRNYAMPARPGAQFLIRLPDAGNGPNNTLAVPRHPVDIPSGAYFIWPFNLRVDGVTIRYSTAQVFTRLENGGQTAIYFEAIPGIPAEFAFDAKSIRSLHASSGEKTTSAGVIYLSDVKPGIGSSIDVVSGEGKSVRLVVLTPEQAEGAWKIRGGDGDRLLITAQDFFTDTEGPQTRVWLQSVGSPDFAFTVTPPLAAAPDASLHLKRGESTARIERFTAEAPPRNVKLEVKQIQTAGVAPPVKLGPAPSWRANGVAEAPDEGELPDAAKWSITVPPGSMDGLSELFLDVHYSGDVARLYESHRLLDDDFFNGHAWTVGLARFLDAQGGGSFELNILPLRSDAPVYFELPRKLEFSPDGQVDLLDSVKLVPEYQLVLRCTSGMAKADGTAQRSQSESGVAAP
jgi:beta-galactosidase